MNINAMYWYTRKGIHTKLEAEKHLRMLQKALDTNETQSYEKIISTPSGSDIVQDNGDHHQNSHREGHGLPSETEGHDDSED